MQEYVKSNSQSVITRHECTSSDSPMDISIESAALTPIVFSTDVPSNSPTISASVESTDVRSYSESTTRTAESQPSQARTNEMHQKRWAIAIPMYNTICEQERADVVCLFMSGTSNIGPKLVTFVGESRSSNQSPNGERSLFRRESQHKVSAPWSRLPLLCSDGAWRTSWTSSLP